MKLSFALCFISSYANAIAPLTLLTDPKARCLDGTLSGYYIEPATAPENSTKFVIYLEGGGECNKQSTCAKATQGPLGSSKFFSSTRYFGEGEAYANALPPNPFRSWNRVDVPYCSQDLFSGQKTSTDPSTFGFYFSGHLILDAVVNALIADHNMASATEIIFTGASAGGIAMWINANWLASKLPKAKIILAPVAGFYFFAFPYQGVNHTQTDLVDFREENFPALVQLYDAYLDPACAAGLGERAYACMLSNYSQPFINLPFFATTAQTDSVQLVDHDWLPANDIHDAPELAYMAQWRDNMTQALQPALSPSTTNGGFNPACFIHTSFNSTSPLINGLSYLSAFENWYLGNGEPSKLFDICGLICNPSCPSS